MMSYYLVLGIVISISIGHRHDNDNENENDNDTANTIIPCVCLRVGSFFLNQQMKMQMWATGV